MSDFANDIALLIPRMRRYARALTHDSLWADDLVQDTLERALRRRWSFRMNSNLPAWLFSILYRLFLNDLARRRDAPSQTEAAYAHEEEAVADPGLSLDIQRALARLSPEHRAVIVLIGLEQLSYREAAEVLDIPLGTVMSRLTRARDHLRQLLSGAPATKAETTTTTAAASITRIK